MKGKSLENSRILEKKLKDHVAGELDIGGWNKENQTSAAIKLPVTEAAVRVSSD